MRVSRMETNTRTLPELDPRLQAGTQVTPHIRYTRGVLQLIRTLQGDVAHKKSPPPRTLL